MKMSNINKFISGLLGVAMCPMMLPTAAFAADDGAASEVSSSPTELIQSSESEGADTGASSGDTLATQSESASEAANATIGKTANEAATLAAETGEEGNEAAAAEVNGKTYSSLQDAIDAASERATVKLLANTKENVTISTKNVTLDLNGYTLNGSTGERKPALTVTSRVYVKDSSKAQTGTIMLRIPKRIPAFRPITSSTFRVAIAAGCSSRAATSRTTAVLVEQMAHPLSALAMRNSLDCRT